MACPSSTLQEIMAVTGHYERYAAMKVYLETLAQAYRRLGGDLADVLSSSSATGYGGGSGGEGHDDGDGSGDPAVVDSSMLASAGDDDDGYNENYDADEDDDDNYYDEEEEDYGGDANYYDEVEGDYYDDNHDDEDDYNDDGDDDGYYYDVDGYGDDDAGGFGGVPASEEAIAELKSYKYMILDEKMDIEDGGGKDNAAPVCVICVEDYEAGDDVTVMPCSHRFHDGCLLRWLSRNRLCPCCRHALRSA